MINRYPHRWVLIIPNKLSSITPYGNNPKKIEKQNPAKIETIDFSSFLRVTVSILYIYLFIYYIMGYSPPLPTHFRAFPQRQGAVGVSKDGVQLKTKAYIAPGSSLSSIAASGPPIAVVMRDLIDLTSKKLALMKTNMTI